MATRIFSFGANVIAFRKNDHDFAMACSWATMIDYDVIGMLIGEQSITGKNIEVGDYVGVSSLAKDQREIALQIGSGHSDKKDKLKNIEIDRKSAAICILNSRVRLFGKVTKILKLDDSCDDLFVIIKAEDIKEDKSKEFLLLSDVYGD